MKRLVLTKEGQAYYNNELCSCSIYNYLDFYIRLEKGFTVRSIFDLVLNTELEPLLINTYPKEWGIKDFLDLYLKMSKVPKLKKLKNLIHFELLLDLYTTDKFFFKEVRSDTYYTLCIQSVLKHMEGSVTIAKGNVTLDNLLRTFFRELA